MDQPDLKYITRSSVVPWVSNNGLRVDKRTSRTITLRWEAPPPEFSNILEDWPDTDTEEPATSDQSTGFLPRIRLGQDSVESIKTNESSGPTLFEVQMKKAGPSDWVTIYKGYAKRFEVEDLKPDTNLSFRMRRNTEDEWGSSIMASTDSPPPNAEDLHVAISSNHEDMVLRIVGSCKPTYLKRMLISHDKSGHTPLMIAALNGNPDLLKLLIKVGANVNAVALNTEQTALMLACFKGVLTCVQLLDAAGADWELKDSSGCSAIHHAVNGESVKALKYALNKRGTEAIEETDNAGWTPLLRAVVLGTSAEIVEFLLKSGANPNAVDSKNTKSCLLAAAMLGKREFITLLLQHHVNINYKNANGKKAIDIAKSKGYTDVVKMLKKALTHPEVDTTIEFIKIPAGESIDKPEEELLSPEPSQVSQESKPPQPPTQAPHPPKDKDPKTDAEYLAELERRLSILAMQAARNEIELRENHSRMLRARDEKEDRNEEALPNKRKNSAKKLNQAQVDEVLGHPGIIKLNQNEKRIIPNRSRVKGSVETKKENLSKISTVKAKESLQPPTGPSRRVTGPARPNASLQSRRPSEPVRRPPVAPRRPSAGSSRPISAPLDQKKKQDHGFPPKPIKRPAPAVVAKEEPIKTKTKAPMIKSKSTGPQQSAAFAKPTTVIKPRRFSDSAQPTTKEVTKVSRPAPIVSHKTRANSQAEAQRPAKVPV